VAITIDITSGLAFVLSHNKRTYPQHVNRVSSLDDPCLRRLYYRRAAWDKAQPIDDGLAGVFATGNMLEPVIERIVSEVGSASTPRWRIVGSQTPTNDSLLKKYQISGSIDGFLQSFDITLGIWITIGVVDVKTMSPNIYPRINCYDDLNRYPWTRGYRGQLMLYSLAHNLERCFILGVNKNNLYEMKLIEFALDMQYVEELLQKAELVNIAIECNEPPGGVNDPDVCPKCAWFSYCCPDLASKGTLEILDQPELEAVLERMAELESTADEYADLEKTRDTLLVKGRDVAVGRFLISWKEQQRKDGKGGVTKFFTKKIRAMLIRKEAPKAVPIAPQTPLLKDDDALMEADFTLFMSHMKGDQLS
jgi:hypothetical protein